MLVKELTWKVRSMARKSGAGQKGTKSGTEGRSPSRLKSSAESGRVRKAVRGRIHHPPPEEDLGGGDICSLEEKPSTEDNMPLVAHVAVVYPKEIESEYYNPKRSLAPVANALMVALFGALSLLIVDHGLWNRPYVESARARAASEAAAEAHGALITPTRRPSLYSRIVRGLR